MKISKKPFSIIIADECEFFRDGICNYLKSKKIFTEIKEASSGIEVLELMESSPSDIILMGIDIGPLNGIETTSFVKQKYPETKIIGVSTHPDELFYLEMFKKGVMGFLLKSVRKSEFLSALKIVIDGHKHLQSCYKTILLKIKDGKFKHAISDKPEIQQRIREIIFLLGKGLRTGEIASALSLSYHTINSYRSKLNKVIGSKRLAILINYGIKCGILDDEALIKKFEQYL